ncbi:MAG: hypothetical protein IT370_30475 [Deltaproteobacteria bacterium]|nr:hypothetical protein [Deltaproteobacteria bacterium]
MMLTSPSETTCGQLLRKDLLVSPARLAQGHHRTRFASGRVCVLTQPRNQALANALIQRPNGHPSDQVVEEVVAFGLYRHNSKIHSIAAVHRIPGAKADVAMSSLGRSYVHRCHERDRRWTAGLHILWWMLQRVSERPLLEPADLRGALGLALDRAQNIAIWTVLALRLYLITDIGSFAGQAHDDVGAFASLADQALGAVEPGDGSGLAAWLSSQKTAMTRTFPRKRYEELAAKLRA